MRLASFGPFRRFVTTSAGGTTPTRPSLPYTTTNESSRLVGRFPRPPSAFPPPPTSHDDSLGGFLASICPSTTTNGVPSASIRGGDFIVYFCRVFPRLPSGGCKIKNKKIIYIFVHLKALNLRL